MRAIIFVFLIYHISVNAQNDKDTTNKPTWAEELPERLSTPDIKLDFKPDSSLDIEIEGLDLDRRSLFEDEEDEPVDDSPDQEQIKQVELEVIATEAANQDKIEEENKQAEILAEQKKQEETLAEQKRQEEILAEQQKIAEQKLIEQVRLDEEQRQAEEKASQTEQQNVADDPITENKPLDSSNRYKWKKTKNVLPSYPISAIKNKTEGWVNVEITIDKNGDVINSKIVASYRNLQIFNRSALKAVNRWKFEPPSNFGIEETLTQTVKIDFQL